jgi:TRAP-type mannitol/chloroaromatic compound transport system permease small subunit
MGLTFVDKLPSLGLDPSERPAFDILLRLFFLNPFIYLFAYLFAFYVSSVNKMSSVALAVNSSMPTVLQVV